MNFKKSAAFLLAALTGCALLTGCNAYQGHVLTREEVFSGMQAEESDWLRSYTKDNVRYNIYEDHAEMTGFLSGFSKAAYTAPKVVDGKPLTVLNPESFIPTSLTSVNIEDSVTSIGDNAFKGFTNLRAVAIPESVSYIGAHAFEGTAWMNEKIEDSPLVIVNSILINGQYASGSVVIPKGVTCIGAGAFLNNQNITDVIVPNSVYLIGSAAFSGCKGLNSVTFRMNSSLVEIGNTAFKNTALVTLKLPGKIETIGVEAFSGCDALTRVEFPGSLKTIGVMAFQSCGGIKDVEFPMSVSSVGQKAFYDCESLRSVTVFNRECEIFTDAGTLGNVPGFTIYGRKGSTAQQYAEACGYSFEAY